MDSRASSNELAAYEQLGAAVIVLDPSGSVVFWNRACSELTGCALDTARGRPLWELASVTGDPAHLIRELTDGPRTTFPCSWTLADGRLRTFELTSSVVVGTDGVIERIILTGLDVTDILTDRVRLQNLLGQAPSGIFLADREGHYTDVNEAGCRLLGYSKQELVGKQITDLIPPEDADRLWESREELLRGATHTADWRLRRKDGSYVPVEVSAKILPDGTWQGFVRDLSERQRLEQTLRESHADLSRAQIVAKLGCWRISVEGQLTWSDETSRIFGIEPGSPVTYEDFLARVHPEDRAYVDRTWSAALRGDPYDIEHRIIVGDTVKWVRERADFEFDELGGLRRGLGVVQDITEQKRATEEQRAWQERLRAIISISADAIISIDEDHRIVIYNEAAQRTFGWTPEEVLGKSIDLLIPAINRQAHRGYVQAFGNAREQSRQTAEREKPVRGLRKNGEEFPAEGAISRIDVGGKKLFTVTMRDISERKRVEDALRLSEERLRLALSASPAVVFNQDLELRYTWVHDPRRPLTPDQVLGRTDRELLLSGDGEHLETLKRGVIATGVGIREILRTTLEGEEIYYDTALEPLRDGTGQVVGITGAGWDVTAQRQSEREQRLLAEASAILAASTPDYERCVRELSALAVRELADWCVIDLLEGGDVRRRKVACSDPRNGSAALALESIEIDLTRPYLVSEQLNHRRSTLVSTVEPRFVESVAQSPEHLRVLRALDMRSFLAVPLIARGRLLGAIALVSSHDSRRYRDADLRFAEELAGVMALAVDNAQLYRETQRALAARDHVLGMVAHDLRNPLNTVLLNAELAQSRGHDPILTKPIDAIRRAAQRMNRLIQDMLDVARCDAGALAVEHAVVSTQGLLEEVIESQRAVGANLEIHVESAVSATISDVFGDHGRLLQVFDNLVGNALKFTPAGGHVVIGAEERPGEVLFWVRDSGPGIAADHLPHLFDRFWQASKMDRRGAGLGLSIVLGIVEAHGGRIWVESKVDRGTTFFFTVPAAMGIAQTSTG